VRGHTQEFRRAGPSCLVSTMMPALGESACRAIVLDPPPPPRQLLRSGLLHPEICATTFQRVQRIPSTRPEAIQGSDPVEMLFGSCGVSELRRITACRPLALRALHRG